MWWFREFGSSGVWGCGFRTRKAIPLAMEDRHATSPETVLAMCNARGHWTTLSRASTHPQRILLPRQALVKKLSKPEVHKTHNLGLPNSRNREIQNSPNHEISNCRNLNSRTPKVPKSRGRQKRTPTAPQLTETKFQKVGLNQRHPNALTFEERSIEMGRDSMDEIGRKTVLILQNNVS